MWTRDPGTGLEELGGPRPGQRVSGRPVQKVQRRLDSVLHGGARSRRPDGREGHRQGQAAAGQQVTGLVRREPADEAGPSSCKTSRSPRPPARIFRVFADASLRLRSEGLRDCTHSSLGPGTDTSQDFSSQ